MSEGIVLTQPQRLWLLSGINTSDFMVHSMPTAEGSPIKEANDATSDLDQPVLEILQNTEV